MQTIVERFNLTKWVGQEEARHKLVQAGYRGQAPYITYPVLPHGDAGRRCSLFAAFYLFVVLELDQPPMVKIGICIAAAYVGMQLPLTVPQEQDRASASCRSSAPFPTRSTCC